MTVSADLSAPSRALAIGAHPDDVEFGCGATLAKWATAGTVVEVVVLTDGSKGTWEPDTDLDELAARRALEQRDAAQILGAHEVHFVGAVDGELSNDATNQARVCELLRRLRPDVVLGHDPWNPHRVHPDHHVAGLLTVAAIVAARDPHFFTDQDFAPHRPEAVLLFEPGEVTHVESVPHSVETKIDALLAHRSQWRSTMHIADTDDGSQRARFASRVDSAARLAGMRIGARAGEVFRAVHRL